MVVKNITSPRVRHFVTEGFTPLRCNTNHVVMCNIANSFPIARTD